MSTSDIYPNPVIFKIKQHIETLNTNNPSALLHDRTASLFQLSQNLGQLLLDHLHNLVLLVLLSMLLSLLLMPALVPSTLVLSLSLMRRPSMALLRLPITTTIAMRHISRPQRLTTLQINVYPASVLLSPVLEPELATQLLDLGLDLLHVVGRVVALADNGVQVVLAALLVGADALLEDALGFLDVQAVQVDAVAFDAAGGVVGAEDVLAGLAVVVVHFAVVGFALVGKFFGAGAVAVVVGLFGLWLASATVSLHTLSIDGYQLNLPSLTFS